MEKGRGAQSGLNSLRASFYCGAEASNILCRAKALPL